MYLFNRTQKLKKHFIKIPPTDCFASSAHQETQHLKKAILFK